jgi:hypothetical protein
MATYLGKKLREAVSLESEISAEKENGKHSNCYSVEANQSVNLNLSVVSGEDIVDCFPNDEETNSQLVTLAVEKESPYSCSHADGKYII